MPTETIPKHPEQDRTLDEVLRTVEFHNQMGNIIISHEIKATEVSLVVEQAPGG